MGLSAGKVSGSDARDFCGFIALFILAVTVSLPLAGPWFDWSRYDQHRIGEIVAIFAAALVVVHASFDPIRGALRVPKAARGMLAVLLLLGLISSLQSAFPGWAFLEMSLIAGCLTLGWFVANVRILIGDRQFDRVLLAAIWFLCAALVLKFLISYLSLLTSDQKVMDTEALMEGFPNLRFFGHFQTLMTPILALPVLYPVISRGRRIVSFVLLVFWWTMVVAGGTRGTWLGLVVTIIAMLFAGKAGRRWSLVQVPAAASGFFLFNAMLTWIPNAFGFQALSHASERLTTTMNARDLMWLRALELTKEHPWFGVGPMHYANTMPPDFAGPHQMILLWFCEWGIPAGILAIALVGWAVVSIVRALNERDQGPKDFRNILYVVITASFGGSLTQAMVCGVFTVPYTQLWLSILGGWLLALHVEAPAKTLTGPFCRSGWRMVAVVSALVLAFAAAYFAPDLGDRRARFFALYPNADCTYPRFWNQGFIGM